MTQRILYILVPDTNISPFDVTLAADAGFSQILPFTGVGPDDVVPLVQDAIFCRPPKRFNDTGIFLGGRDVHLATDMFQNAKKAMVGPFEVGVFVDPNGAYTTSASIVALVEQAVLKSTGGSLEGRHVSVFGTGPVGLSAAVLSAQQGARTTLCQLTADDDEHVAKRFCERYNVDVAWASAQTHHEKAEVLKETEVAICAAKAGIRILEKEELDYAEKLLVAADTNAVPPTGIEGVEANDKFKPVEMAKSTFLSIGSLAIGNLKYKTQYGLFVKMQQSEKAALLDFKEAYQFAISELRSSDAKKDAA
ncbi:MAG: methylenetetrahydromethanopterin dehydrogenase [Proteobacteria bacterium]|nr:methylenetetrahydromethanopterin dehydrogenase [Pseudomonadota bacterium]NOG59992.1 methylenetetrahydromethanopterin dehydrogenase [Pseudomonadota bacterium]